MKLQLGFLCSHSGSNMQAIIDNVLNGALPASLCAMVSNNSDAYALQRAKNANIPSYVINSKTHTNPDAEIVHVFKQHDINVVVLAGYMKQVSPELINAFDGQVLNIHPALLPKFGGKGMYGMNVHKAVIAAGEKISGATIHIVTPNYDDGRILAQMKTDVLPDDTAETLAERVLQVEHKIYSDTLLKLAKDELSFK
jgi:phosphoribosylglycinamide formyltransferase-1